MRFLLDEHLSLDLIMEVKRFDASIDILRVGQRGALPLGTLDPDLLVFCESDQRVLVTDNRKSMPCHARDHFAFGRHHWGILEIRKGTSFGALVRELCMFWGASEAEEWIDRQEYIPY